MMHLKFASIFLALMLLVTLRVHAQDARDPTLPPPEVGVAPGAAAASPLGDEGIAVIVRDGKSFLMVGTRLYAPGQKVGQLRVKRITETEVWLQDGSELRKVPRFAGIQRTVNVPPAPCAPELPAKPQSKSKPKPKSKVAQPVACDSTQP
jgi:outer membrane biosynthesis protein TonB